MVFPYALLGVGPPLVNEDLDLYRDPLLKM